MKKTPTLNDIYFMKKTLDDFNLKGDEREKMLKALIEMYGDHMEGSKTIQDYYDDYRLNKTKEELEEIVKKAEAAKQAEEELAMKKNKKENTVKMNLPSDLNEMWFGSHEGKSIQERCNIQRTLDGLYLEGEEREKAEKELTQWLIGRHEKELQAYDEFMIGMSKKQLEEKIAKQAKEDEEELIM